MRFWTLFAVSFGFVSVALAQPPVSPLDEVGMDPFERDSLIQELALPLEQDATIRMASGLMNKQGQQPPTLLERKTARALDGQR